ASTRPPKGGSVLPMCPVRSVTYVSGRSSNTPSVSDPFGPAKSGLSPNWGKTMGRKPTRFFAGRHWEETQRLWIPEGGHVAPAGLNGAITPKSILDRAPGYERLSV